MFEYLRPSSNPVIPEFEEHETVYAAHQPQYTPLRTLLAPTQKGEVLSRWTFTPEEREAIAMGADVYLELLTFNKPLQPIRLMVADEIPADYSETYRPKLKAAGAEIPPGPAGGFRNA